MIAELAASLLMVAVFTFNGRRRYGLLGEKTSQKLNIHTEHTYIHIVHTHTHTRCRSETVASCEGPEIRDGIGEGREEKKRRSARNPVRVLGAMCKTGETWTEGEKRRYNMVLVQ